jgi:lysyl-tRNA synthetase class 2
MNEIEQVILERQVVNDSIRSFFRERGYLEVETPLVVRSPGMEPNLFPFETVVREPDGKAHSAGLITSPEYSMKKLLGLGMQKIFTITKVFRNEESFGGAHNPEFTMLEWYRQGADYQACMDETWELVSYVAQNISPLPKRGSRGVASKVDRIRVRDLFLDCVGLDLDIAQEGDLRRSCRANGIKDDPPDTESDLFYRLFLTKVEPTFAGRSLFVYDYPRHQAALSAMTADGKYGQRFELYIDGVELCNGFTELTDAVEQRARFEEEANERQRLGKRVFPIDEELLCLLPSLRSPTFGNALGVDRLHMILTGRSSIEDVLPFPALKIFPR